MTCPHTPTPSTDLCRSRRRERIHLTRIGVKHLPWGECASCGMVLPPAVKEEKKRKPLRGSQAVRQRTVNPSSAGPIPAPSAKITPSPASKTGSLPSDTQRPGSVSALKGAERGGRDPKKGRATGKDAPQPIDPTVKESLTVPAPSKMGRPPKCKCAVCKVVNRGGRPKGMTRQGEKRKGWPLGVKRGPRKVAA